MLARERRRARGARSRVVGLPLRRRIEQTSRHVSTSRVTGALPIAPLAQPPMIAENSPAPPPACTISRPPSRNFGRRRARLQNASGMPSAMPPRAAHDLLGRRAAAARRAPRAAAPSIQPASRNTRACSGETTSIASHTMTFFGCATVRRHAANVRASDSGVARELVDDAAHALGREQRDRVGAGRQAALDCERLPRRAGLVLGEAERVLARDCRASRGRPRPGGRRRRCGSRAAARGRSSRWRGCPGRAR